MTPATPSRPNLLGLTRPELEAFAGSIGEKPFRARQLMKWLYKRSVADFAQMTDLAKDSRARLAEVAEVRVPEVLLRQTSADGTRKWLLSMPEPLTPALSQWEREKTALTPTLSPREREKTALTAGLSPEWRGGQAVEMVYIPEADRGTLCISSQIGCAMDCSFCSTAQQGFNRNLSVADIVGQVWLANRELGNADQFAGPPADRVITNVVFMGMGEPLANYRNIVPATEILMDDLGFDISRRRVTVSTSGLVPQMRKLAEETNCALAVSLHAPNDALRDQLVPINRKHPIAELLDACWYYVERQNARGITFEYVMLDGVNDQPAHALELAALLKGKPGKVNLIPFNIFPGTQYRRSPEHVIERFRDILNSHAVIATTRRTRGDDIDAACGQLVGRVRDRTTVRLGSKVMSVAVQS